MFLHQDQVRDTVQLAEEVLREDDVIVPETNEAFLALLRAVRRGINFDEPLPEK